MSMHKMIRMDDSIYHTSEADIQSLGQFIHDTGVDLIYGLNVLERHEKDGKWNSTNSIKLINYMSKLGVPVAGWELGNGWLYAKSKSFFI